MSRREKLFARMRANPRNVRFSQVHSLLKYEGFVLFNQRGSHGTYHRAEGAMIDERETAPGPQDMPSGGY